MVFVFTGQSGLERKPYLDSMENLAHQDGKKFKVFHVGDLMYAQKPGLERGKILDLPLAEIRAILAAVIEQILGESKEYNSIAVSMHATFRWKRGLISGTDFSLFSRLSPDVFITLIDDVHDVKWRLDQEYAHLGYTYKDAMVWREEEILATSIFAKTFGKPHYLFARKHPVGTLYKLLFKPDLPKVYVSFPISAVVDKPEILSEIQGFKSELAEHFTVFDPYTISEKRLAYKAQVARKAGKQSFDYDTEGGSTTIQLTEVESILKDIDDQIVARDLHLVEQSEIIVAFYPCFEDGTPIHSGGRERETTHARDTTKRVFIIWPSHKDPGPFESDNAERIFREVGEAREFMLSTLPQPS